jgi:hypothetical protein
MLRAWLINLAIHILLGVQWAQCTICGNGPALAVAWLLEAANVHPGSTLLFSTTWKS